MSRALHPSPRCRVVALLTCLVVCLVVSLGLAAPVPTAQSVRPGPRPTLTGPAEAVAPGVPVRLRGRAAPRSRVVLQRREGRRWAKVNRQRATGTGRFAFRITPAADASYRVSVRGRHSRVVRVRLAPAVVGPRTAAVSAPTSTDPHTRLPVSATFTPARPGSPVALEALTDGGWRRVGDGVEDGAGRTVLLATPRTTTTYRVVGVGATSEPTTIAVRPARTMPWVTGYYAGWFWDQEYGPDEVEMGDLTHFVFGRVAPGGGSLDGAPGEIVPGAGSAHDPAASPYPGTTVEDHLVRKAHAAGVEALLMLGGDGFDGRGFVASTADAVRSRFVRNVVDYLVAHDYDGVDVDWENCLGGEAWECGVDITTEEAVRRLRALIVEVRAEMATRPRYRTDPGLVTFPGYAVKTNELRDGEVADWQAELPWLVDQYNLMSYGIGTTWNGAGWESWFSGALDDEGPARPVSIDSSIDAYELSGAPREKIGMGIGFYGIYFGPGITGPRQSTKDNDVYETNDAALSWTRLKELGYLSHGVEHWDAAASSTYRTYAGGYVPSADPGLKPAGFLSYEDERSIAAKAAYARAGGAGGTIVWTLNYGDDPDGGNPLLDAVGTHFLDR
ncbi:glycosyl hydrolase family 18 protein [Nocardioides sp. L-11A]|uniref:glycosyl hydrolase family 18 protein n=1 Tax=Nocardioides sp. L-11A TaxID=3043848 RepID=UPI00249C9A80|nr:glycosyl hydrolase family 18 protein [Nocardioides sp. L-11A]